MLPWGRNCFACVAQWIGRLNPNVVSVGSIHTVETKHLQLGSTLMVSIFTPWQPMPNSFDIFII